MVRKAWAERMGLNHGLKAWAESRGFEWLGKHGL